MVVDPDRRALARQGDLWVQSPHGGPPFGADGHLKNLSICSSRASAAALIVASQGIPSSSANSSSACATIGAGPSAPYKSSIKPHPSRRSSSADQKSESRAS